MIDKTQFTSPVTYKIKDLSGENILESFYEPELSTASQEVFRVEKVLKGNNYKNKEPLLNGLDIAINGILEFGLAML